MCGEEAAVISVWEPTQQKLEAQHLASQAAPASSMRWVCSVKPGPILAVSAVPFSVL